MEALITLTGSIFFLVSLSIFFSFGLIYFLLSFTRFKASSLVLSTVLCQRKWHFPGLHRSG